jgi:hypothetical protein
MPFDSKLFEKLVLGRLRLLRVQREAKRRLDAEERPLVAAPEVLTLRDRLTHEPAETCWRVKEWAPVDSRTLLTAQYKAGKTTLTINFVKSLVTGEPFLGVAEVTPVDGPVLVIDAEMSSRQLDDWYRQHAIPRDDLVFPLPLRGKLSAFNILDLTVRAEWAARFRALGIRYVVLDCVRPFFDVLGLDEQHEAGRFLVAFDALLVEADVREALVVQHMGHGGERARGDSRFLDWPDTIWRLTRRTSAPESGRYISAYGRDVNIPESALQFNPAWRQLTLTGGSRQDAITEEALPDVLTTLGKGEQKSFNDLVAAVSAGSLHSRDVIRAAIKFGVKQGSIVTISGPRKSQIHRLADHPPSGSPK